MRCRRVVSDLFRSYFASVLCLLLKQDLGNVCNSLNFGFLLLAVGVSKVILSKLAELSNRLTPP